LYHWYKCSMQHFQTSSFHHPVWQPQHQALGNVSNVLWSDSHAIKPQMTVKKEKWCSQRVKATSRKVIIMMTQPAFLVYARYSNFNDFLFLSPHFGVMWLVKETTLGKNMVKQAKTRRGRELIWYIFWKNSQLDKSNPLILCIFSTSIS
jgi:hypothetical protein